MKKYISLQIIVKKLLIAILIQIWKERYDCESKVKILKIEDFFISHDYNITSLTRLSFSYIYVKKHKQNFSKIEFNVSPV